MRHIREWLLNCYTLMFCSSKCDGQSKSVKRTSNCTFKLLSGMLVSPPNILTAELLLIPWREEKSRGALVWKVICNREVPLWHRFEALLCSCLHFFPYCVLKQHVFFFFLFTLGLIKSVPSDLFFAWDYSWSIHGGARIFYLGGVRGGHKILEGWQRRTCYVVLLSYNINVRFPILKEAWIDNFLIFVNNDTNVYSKIGGQRFLRRDPLPPFSSALGLIYNLPHKLKCLNRINVDDKIKNA